MSWNKLCSVLAATFIVSSFFALSAIAQSCPYPSGAVSLSSVSLSASLVSDENVTTTIFPTFDPLNTFFYNAYTNEAISNGVGTFTVTFGQWSAGAQLRVAFDNGAFTYFAAGSAPLSLSFTPTRDGSQLIQFEVVQNPCAGDWVQAYSLSIAETACPEYASGLVVLDSLELVTIQLAADGPLKPLTVVPAFDPVNTFFYSATVNASIYVASASLPLALTFGSWSAGAQLRVACNNGPFTYYSAQTAPLTVTCTTRNGNQLVQFEVVQDHCAGNWVQPYSLAVYEGTYDLDDYWWSSSSSTAPAITQPAAWSSTAAAATISSSCPYPSGAVSLSSVSLSASLVSDENVTTTIFPTFDPLNTFFYNAYTNEAISNGVGTFTVTFGQWSAGAQLRVAFDNGAFTYFAAGSAPLSLSFTPTRDGSQLIQFEVVQNPCAGDWVQAYSLSIAETACPEYASGLVVLDSLELVTIQLAADGPLKPLTVVPAFDPVNTFFYSATVNASIYVASASLPLALTFGSWSAGAQLRVACNNGPFTYYSAQTAPLTVTCTTRNGNQLVQFEVVQDHCAGNWVQPYSLAVYEGTYDLDDYWWSSSSSTAPAITQPAAWSSTAAAASVQEDTASSIVSSCPYPSGVVYLSSVSCYIQVTSSSDYIPLTMTTTFDPLNIFFYYAYINQTLFANISTILCAFGNWSNGAQLRVAYNNFDDFTYYNNTLINILVTNGLSKTGSQLIQFEVVQNQCAGNWIQPYSLTIYDIADPSDPPAVTSSVCDTTTVAVFADVSYESAWLQLFTNILLNGCMSPLCPLSVTGILSNEIIIATLQQFLHTILPVSINNDISVQVYSIGETIKAILAIQLGCSQYALTTAPFDLNGFMSAATTNTWSNETINAFNGAWVNASLSVGISQSAVTQAIAPFLIH